MAWIFYSDGKLNLHKFYLHQQETLLAGLLRVGIKAQFECRQGYCGVCKVKYRALNAKTRLDYTLSPLVMLAEDELLPCCCRVQGALVIKTAVTQADG